MYIFGMMQVSHCRMYVYVYGIRQVLNCQMYVYGMMQVSHCQMEVLDDMLWVSDGMMQALDGKLRSGTP